MIDYLGMVKEFHEKYDHAIAFKPRQVSEETAVLRVKLIDEESIEFATEALSFEDNPPREASLVGIADALADLLYVTFGTALSYGIPIGEIFAEVHRSNMTKSMLRDEEDVVGKTIKGDSYEAPKLQPIIDKHMK